jgi:glutamate-5-semialdehyde dehydrogenase
MQTSDDTAQQLIADMGKKARAASAALANVPVARKADALNLAAAELRARAEDILAANQLDLDAGEANGLSAAMLDRLRLTPERLEGIAAAVDSVAVLRDPVGMVIDEAVRPNGLHLSRVRVPLGVIGIIYESRPNVTADAAALCLKSGNAAILRGGSDSYHSSSAIHACLVEGLKAAGLPEDCIQRVPTKDRAAVGEMLKGLGGNLDVIVPRGGKSLVARVQAEARVPVFAHLEGIVHVYVHKAADLEKAKALVLNSKMRRTGVCGSAETLLFDRAILESHAGPIVAMLLAAGCEVRGDAAIQALTAGVTAAKPEDFGHEFLDSIIAAKVVDGPDEAIDHVERFGSHHTDMIITEDQAIADRFLVEVDSAITVHIKRRVAQYIWPISLK